MCIDVPPPDSELRELRPPELRPVALRPLVSESLASESLVSESLESLESLEPLESLESLLVARRLSLRRWWRRTSRSTAGAPARFRAPFPPSTQPEHFLRPLVHLFLCGLPYILTQHFFRWQPVQLHLRPPIARATADFMSHHTAKRDVFHCLLHPFLFSSNSPMTKDQRCYLQELIHAHIYIFMFYVFFHVLFQFFSFKQDSELMLPRPRTFSPWSISCRPSWSCWRKPGSSRCAYVLSNSCNLAILNQSRKGSFSSVSTPSFASKLEYSLESS